MSVLFVGEARRGDDERSPMLSADSVKSVVTINHVHQNNPKLASVELRRRRQSSLLGVNGSKSRFSTSVATSSFSSNEVGDDYEPGHSTTTLVATCNRGATGRIHLATVVEGPEENIGRMVRLKYSSKAGRDNSPLFATVCIATFPSKTNQPSAAILAIDVEGKLYAHHIETNESDDNNHLFHMDLCFSNEVETVKQKSPKRGKKSKATSTQNDPVSSHPFTSMNTLTARMESGTANNCKSYASKKSSQEAPCSTPNRKGQKRKATTPSKNDEGGQVVYAVASSLNESHLLPSQSPPVIIRLSLDEIHPYQGSKLTGVSWSTVPGLNHVNSPMACITFASRASCGNSLWSTLVSLMRCDEGQDHAEIDVDEGIVLMGFQDGSLYATTVINGEPGHASKLLKLNSFGEPFLSLHFLRAESTEPKLMCVGALGTLAIIYSDKNGAVKVEMKRLPFQGRSCSLACVGYHKSASNGTDLSLIGTNDTGKTYLYQLSVRCEESIEKNNLQLRNVIRVPISSGNVSSIHNRQFEFAWSSASGKVSLLWIASDQKVRLATRSKHSLLATLRKKDNSRCTLSPNRIAKETNAVSKYATVVQSLKAAMSTKQGKDDIHPSVALLDFQSNHVTKEVRDAIRVVSLSSTNAPPPIQCTINASNTAKGFDLEMKTENMAASSSWCHSIHTIASSMILPESIKDMTPLCYRRTGDGLVKVLYGGSSTSISCQNSSSMHVPMHDFAPISMYASLSKVFIENRHADNNAWEESVRLSSNVDVLNVRGQAKRARMQSVVVPFKLGKMSSVPLSGDVFTPFLQFANIVRVELRDDVRNVAEKEVQHLVQDAGDRKSLLAKMNYETAVYDHPNANEKVHCCSSSVLLASSKNIELYHKYDSCNNAGIFPIALVVNSQKDTGICELGFAFGSDSNNSNEIMSLVPLMRHSIIRYSQREEELVLDVLTDECYSRLLSDKRAAKIAKHVDKCSRELLSRIEMSSYDDICPTALLTKCVSLYEMMRTLQFIIG